MVKVTIKFLKDTFQLTVDEEDNYELFQAKVYALTTVPPKSMKLLEKGKQIKNNAGVKALKQGTVLTLFGTPEQKALKKIQAVDKIVVTEKKATDKKEYYGLQNLGNTCYLNAGVQLLRAIPELRQWVKNAKLNTLGFQGAINSLGKIWQKLDKGTVAPKQFVLLFLMMNQQFGPLGKQQDSEEFVQKLLEYFQKVGKIEDKQGKQDNVSSHFFDIEFEQRLKNLDLPQQQVKVSISHSLKLGCTIGGNIDLKIKSLNEGIKAYLTDTVEKTSPTNNQLCHYSKQSRINSLPPYLMVQMVRFFWKQANELSGTKATSTKITKAIDFGLNLDLYEFCSENLKQRLDKGRQYDKKKQQQKKVVNDNRLQDFRQKNKDANLQQRQLFKQFKAITQKEDLKEHNDEIYREHGFGLQTGEYNLVGVITHQGLSADSGHYLAWVHQSGQMWNQFNDDLVTDHKQEDVLNLKGGLSNNQMAYILLFRKREVM